METARTLLVLAAASIGDDGTQWVEVIPTATEARNGRWFFTITRADLDVYAESIRAQPGLIPIDYDHDSSDGGSTAAAGWFTGDTQVVEADAITPTGEKQQHTSLWAKVKWTPQGADDVRSGRFKRMSPEFTFRDRDEKSGLLSKAKEIIASTLTNRPFFRQMAAVGAAGDVIWESTQAYSYLQQRVSAALNPDGGIDWRYWVQDVMPGAALVCESSSGKTWVAPFEINQDGSATVSPTSEWMEAKQEWVQAAEAALESGRRPSPRTKEHDMDVKVLAKSLGLPEDATEEQITEAVKAANATAAELATVKAENETLKAAAGDKTEIEKLRSDLDAERSERRAEKIETILATAVTDRRIDPAAKPVLAEQYAENVDGLSKLIATFPAKAQQAAGGGGSGKENTDLEGDAAALATEYQQATGDRVISATADELTVEAATRKALADKGKTDPTSEEYLAEFGRQQKLAAAAA